MPRVLIVEDDALIAGDVEQALLSAGYDICGVASSEREALLIASRLEPELAVIDVKLDPGDGRNVARELAVRYKTTILMATAEDPASLIGVGATAVLPKPYDANLVPAALDAVIKISETGLKGRRLPDHMKPLA